ncbi:PAS domain-containing protein [Leptolyngbya sp. 'hensonii']|uniref:PAS domain-containing protein n=1 Tax=Leptolyngbya sp. 'hensonii' TaxID=1922337 RepID=UPI0025B77FA5|nr:PAS domain-containing protein [Leptolyngbya sp. 'hensonii']
MLMVSTSLLLMLLLEPWFEVSKSPFLLFFSAVMLSAWAGGLQAGITATILAALASTYFLTPPFLSFTLDLPGSARLGLFILQGLLVSGLCEALRVARLNSEKSTRQLTDTLESISDAFFTVDADWHLTYVNCRLEEVTGRSRKEMLGCLFWEVFPEAVGSAFGEQYGRVMAERVTATVEAPAPDGSGRWFSARAYPIVNGLAVYFHDVTEKKRADMELQTSQTLLNSLLSSSPVGIAFLDQDLRYLHANEALATINGLPLADHFNKTVWDLLPAWADLVAQMVKQVIQTGEPLLNQEFQGETHPPGVIRHCLVNYYPVYLPDGQRGVGVSSMDVTDLKRSEAAQQFLAEASQVLFSSLDYQTTLASIAQLVVPKLADWCTVHIVDTAGGTRQLAVTHADPEKIAWVNELQQRYPYNPQATRGVAQVIRTGQAELYPEISDALLVEVAQDEEHLAILRSAGFTSAMAVPMQVRDRTLGAISFVTTASGRHYSQADLNLAEELGRRAALAIDNAELYAAAQRNRSNAEAANRVKDEFLAVLSHELRSPLNPILGWAQLLRTRKFNQQMTEQALQTIERNAKLQAQLIEDLLDVSRILRGKLSLDFQIVNLVKKIEAAIETVYLSAKAKSIQIQTQFNPDASLVAGDSTRLQQIIWNLLSNAVKFTAPGGQVVVKLSLVLGPLSSVLSSATHPAQVTDHKRQMTDDQGQMTNNKYAQITVTDNGKGISSDFLPYVFDYFRQEDSTTTRKFGGLGLGLAIVRHLVELHGGTVAVESPGEGLGATFTVLLPLLAQDEVAMLQNKKQPLGSGVQFPPLTDLKILVVDDEADMLEMTAMLLRQEGAIVYEAKAAEVALEILQKQRPDILLCDIGMPKMDGYMLLQRVRSWPTESGGQIPAIALTAYAGEANRKKALAAGFQLHLAKPINPDELVRAISEVMQRD